MQETEINTNLDHNLLSFPGYSIEVEQNTQNARVAFYISNSITYIRRRDLEGQDSNIIIIDLMGVTKWRLINIYRSFSPQHNLSQRDKFLYQLIVYANLPRVRFELRSLCPQAIALPIELTLLVYFKFVWSK